MVECGLPKPETRVRFPSPAPILNFLGKSQSARFPHSHFCQSGNKSGNGRSTILTDFRPKLHANRPLVVSLNCVLARIATSHTRMSAIGESIKYPPPRRGALSEKVLPSPVLKFPRQLRQDLSPVAAQLAPTEPASTSGNGSEVLECGHGISSATREASWPRNDPAPACG